MAQNMVHKVQAKFKDYVHSHDATPRFNDDYENFWLKHGKFEGQIPIFSEKVTTFFL